MVDRMSDVTDKRLARGERSRQVVLRAAADVASLDGLESTSFGRLAEATGLSKAGIQTLFGTKERLQLDTIGHARAMFRDAVLLPAEPAAPGLARLRRLLERWITYARKPLFAGGCFWSANLVVYDSRPGPVRDALVGQQREWRRTLSVQIRRAVAAGEVAEVDPDLTALQLDAVLHATNTALRLGERGAVPTLRRLADSILAPR
jgi:AcrR family transcriptional regulator